MTHHKKASNVGVYIAIPIIILAWIIYLVSSTNLFTKEIVPTAWGSITNSNYETINIWHTAFALDPEIVTVKVGKNYKLIITPTENGKWCMTTMTIPGIDDAIYPIKKGQAITITIDNAQAGNYEVVCWAMGMYQWSIVIQ